MKVEWVRIHGFRSIIDTGRLYIDPMLTVLAGKNESGKSNILRALDMFSAGGYSDGDFPEGNVDEELSSRVEVSVKLDFDDVKSFLTVDSDYKHIENASYSFTMVKNFHTNVQGSYGTVQRCFLTNECFDLIGKLNGKLIKLNEEANLSKPLERKAEFLHREACEYLGEDSKQEDVIFWLRDYTDRMKMLYDSINSSQEENFWVKQRKNVDDLRVFYEDVKQLHDVGNEIFDRYKEFEKSIVIPKFKLLQSFEKPLPDSVDFFDETEGWAQYIQRTLEANEGKSFSEMSNREIKRGLDRVSREITELIQRVYSQSQIKLQLDIGVNNNLDVYIYDGENHIDFMPSQRSKGFQWFLSFFFAINAVQRTGDIILLDEPGPYLHPKAQNDVLKALEILAKSDQIMFTTHSPYLINPNTLERVRLVTRDSKNCTVIQNQVHATPIADKEVYTPIMTAIGLDLSKSFGTFGDNNVIVEGISDYYYLESMKEYINFEGKTGIMRFVPSIGASKTDKLASLLIGWGINFKVLLDNDKAGKDEEKKLKDKLLLSEEQIVFVSDKSELAIEDLFSREDFLAYVAPNLEISEENKDLKNSSLLSGKKALIAKVFKERLQKEDIIFTPQTIDNFTNLFRKLYGVDDVRAEEMESVQ
ncbi:hypothetical protein BCJMU51_4430 [Bacillus cereus]|uniref:AAA family ATPase n=1 Tax=Bacillus cereus group TaxID=86661 RepID=UPI001F15F587|nr:MULTISPECIES: AAA family ATPase [Bacillus cereus group]BCB39511.1 hypothetical protein BCM0045_4406 [Bacillus cereus]BCC02352.1 hypothetical protein BCM0057_4434 [Bacillus cereus]BCC25864.1 hypothetical protein BCM0079_4457 [Bacillus cereus]BCC37432.1 hypothetical protein BCM0105_4422 [Bacillus cereus]BCC43234.1 hypothetical protein BCJMU01_4401 [Bacillus cereus]